MEGEDRRVGSWWREGPWPGPLSAPRPSFPQGNSQQEACLDGSSKPRMAFLSLAPKPHWSPNPLLRRSGGSGDKAAPALPAATLGPTPLPTPGIVLTWVFWSLRALLPSSGHWRRGGCEQTLPHPLFTRAEAPQPPPAIREAARGLGALLTRSQSAGPSSCPLCPALSHANQHSKPCSLRPGQAPPAGGWAAHTHTPGPPSQFPELAQTPCAPIPSHRVARVLVGTFGDSRPEEDSGVQRGRPLTLGSIRENAHPSQGQGTGQASCRKGGCRSAPWWGLSAQSTLLCQHSLCWLLPNASGHRQDFPGQSFVTPGTELLNNPKDSARCVGASQSRSSSLRHQKHSE